jgi:molecular chaperone DnaK
LAEASGTLAQKLYAEQAEQGAAEPGTAESGGDDVVDAEFEEVDDEKKPD